MSAWCRHAHQQHLPSHAMGTLKICRRAPLAPTALARPTWLSKTDWHLQRQPLYCLEWRAVVCREEGLVCASFKLVRLKQRCTLFSWFAATSGGSFLFLFLFYGGADDTD
mmetsp:Transcript_46198/g.67802  ORF Transcript_46198/g.67802 Transcript_46198/m.67802 type:complete len:110 (+) Transcript_46198:18-347(+)